MTKLLIVDDEPYTVEMLRTFFRIKGYETIEALNGEDGLVLAKVEAPEAVILDLMLPDIEGYEVCQRIRSFPATTNLPVLILSALADSASKARAKQSGADAYLVKPVRFPELLSELNRVLLARKADALPLPAESKPSQQTVAPQAGLSSREVDPDDTKPRRHTTQG